MAIYPQHVFTKESAVVAFNERYRSSPLGIKYAGQPPGVYIGFDTSTVGSVLTLSPDPTFGFSLIKLASRFDPSGLDLIVTNSIDLDFSGQLDVDFPMVVVARADYVDDPSVPTRAELVTRTGGSGSLLDHEVLVCIVDGPPLTISVVDDPSLGFQTAPIAFENVNIGFMPSGSVEDLQEAADAVDEVVAARFGLSGTTHASLKDRIDSDYSATSMASRLAVVFRVLRSNDYSVASGATLVNVSGSFSALDRDFAPSLTLGGGGGESTVGALSSPNDSVRNVALIVNADSGYRPVNNQSDRQVVFGRVTGPVDDTLSGNWQFLNATKTVTTTDGNGQALVEVEVGDTVLGPDGNYYEVEGVASNNSMTLKVAYQGESASAGEIGSRRWRLLFKTLVAGVETETSFADDLTLRFFFPAFVSAAEATADWSNALATSADREPLQDATTTTPGRIVLAETGSLLGAINIQNGGVPLAGGPFHTINFNAIEASVSDAGDGEVEVVEIGPTGPQGVDGATGPPGPIGEQGVGFTTKNTFEYSTEFSTTAFGEGARVSHSFTIDAGHEIHYLHGGIKRWRDNGYFAVGVDGIRITNISKVSPTEGRIEIEQWGDTNSIVYICTAG